MPGCDGPKNGEDAERNGGLVEARGRDVPEPECPLEGAEARGRHIETGNVERGLQERGEGSVRDCRLDLDRAAGEHERTGVAGGGGGGSEQGRLADSGLTLDLEQRRARVRQPAGDHAQLCLAADDLPARSRCVAQTHLAGFRTT